MMKTIVKILLAVFMLSLVPTTYVCAQGSIETPAERKARQEREAAAKKKLQQDAAARRQREEEARKKREAEEQAAREAHERQRIFSELAANMVHVEGGTFTMGKSIGYDGTKDTPTHQVTLSSFYICKYEVTQDLWEAVMGSNPSKHNGIKRPVENVSWEDCQMFITKLNQMTGKQYRLPTEAEWEYAARGGNQSKNYWYAGSNDVGDVAWYKENSDNQTHDVGMRRANELGLYDMSGNVSEWVQDWMGNYSSASQTNPKGPSSGSNRVSRGGSWDGDGGYGFVWFRNGPKPEFHYSNLGLRLAL